MCINVSKILVLLKKHEWNSNECKRVHLVLYKNWNYLIGNIYISWDINNIKQNSQWKIAGEWSIREIISVK